MKTKYRIRDWWTVRDPLRWLRVQASWWRPRFHTYKPMSDWAFNLGPLCINWETRYYRTTGLQVWLGDHMWLVQPMTPSESDRKALDEHNARAYSTTRGENDD